MLNIVNGYSTHIDEGIASLQDGKEDGLWD